MHNGLTETERQLRLKLRDDFLYYSSRCLVINTKNGTTEKFKLNKAQQYVHSKLEDQLKRTGRVRALILKGRQQGISTYIQGRFLWLTTHRRGIKAFILTNSHAATASLYTMTRRYYSNLPLVVKPAIAKNNGAELDFQYLDSGYRVSTSGSQGVGRGSTITLFHGSEVAYWKNGEDHLPGILQAVPDASKTEILLESTAAGPQGLFYKMCMDAYTGKSEFELIFVPWWWQDEYSDPIPDGFEPTPEEQDYMTTHGATLGNIVWRRRKINTFVRGIIDFRREYPATVEEAFSAESEEALWTREDFTNISHSKYNDLVEEYGEEETVIGFDPAGSSNEGSDENGIIIATKLGNGKVYIRKDLSGKYAPTDIVKKTIEIYWAFDADRLTIETNYGGHWVTDAFAVEDSNVYIHTVHARKGKFLRAQPVAQAYRRGLVVHVGDLSALEAEQTTWNPNDTKSKSPNRIDALVYSVQDLLDLNQAAKKDETPVLWSLG